ncbi:sulfotransferase family protein [Flavilitoribacter nigricans]|uniref:Sulfotransferase domain-containing protein n=1 Tax=Flavilitoribacter nigricans (strain ATCC 23147 / DSM 23189 / NBRC 102662 / NCIMB 1420 / SS-2) TaxID=1122177 RepID=A0A2D0N6Q5_FLAN2|nr:hypothetical protein [Flavilitoribacter nigricans]PHN03463.1 hypothetical protein CRP01_26020 [Flavilitoribacter nigricans DSM 23189 = NBRC 102662]
MAQHVLILGCGRSGTSIFGELFDQLPDYTYYSEPDFALLRDLDYTRPVAVKVPREHPDYPATPGLPFSLEALQELFPEPRRIFWQIRHPLDTIASLKVGISRNWGHHPRPPDWQEWLHQPLVIRCAYHWNFINTLGFRQVGSLAQLSRFEEMLEDPLGFAMRIGQEVGVDTAGRSPHLEAWARRVQNTNNARFVEAHTSRPYSTRDHRVRIGRWRENLTPDEVESVTPIIEDTAARFGYRW